jgi:hypothetical protein
MQHLMVRLSTSTNGAIGAPYSGTSKACLPGAACRICTAPAHPPCAACASVTFSNMSCTLPEHASVGICTLRTRLCDPLSNVLPGTHYFFQRLSNPIPDFPFCLNQNLLRSPLFEDVAELNGLLLQELPILHMTVCVPIGLGDIFPALCRDA